jgi:hypothetical protein
MFADSPLGTLDCIERVVFEDVYPIATGLALPSSSPASLVTIYDDCKTRITNERHEMDVLNSIVAAMGQFSELESLEYNVGFGPERTTPVSNSPLKDIIAQLPGLTSFQQDDLL